ncbi:MAG TPA: hypothetical protein VFJ58_09340 [Armatimonadota bacterium]|nr:hypothetical protein [Armatimonadota bacterium]
MRDSGFFRQRLHLLMTGYGYNLYDSVNRARADDLLVRQRACASLGDAAGHLREVAGDFTRRFIPPASRDQPFPPADRMEQLRDLDRLREEVEVPGSHIRGMSAPTEDRTWARFRDEATALEHLLGCDYELISQSRGIADRAAALTAETWSLETAAELRSLLATLRAAARDRERYLTTPF